MVPYRFRSKAKAALCLLLSVVTGLPVPARAGDLFQGAKAYWDHHKGIPSAEALAVEITCLEKHLDCYGTVVAKQPDVWGQARMMKHRQDFESQIALELTKFRPSLQGSLSRTDQAFLASAFSLSAAISGAPAVQLPQSASTSQEIVSRQAALLKAQGVANPTTAQLQAAGTPAPIKIPETNPADKLTDDFDTKGVIQRRDLTKVETGVKFASDSTISLEPTEYLDQLARYLNHLNELRRINEGDDTADSPGYALHLVRIPVSIRPGTHTRKGFGAEITVTATPYLGRDLLPTTFRNLAINDVVSQSALALTQFFNSPNLLDGFKTFHDDLLKAAEAGEEAGNQAADAAQYGFPAGAANTTRRQPTKPALSARAGTQAGRDPALRRTAQDLGAAPAPPPAPVRLDPRSAFKMAYQNAFKQSFEGSSKTGEPLSFLSRSNRLEKNFTAFQSRAVPATRFRNARYAFPGTQMGEVYGGDLILPVALQTYDVVLDSQIDDDHALPVSVQYQQVAGHIQDQVVAAYDFLARPESVSLWTTFATPALATAVRSRDFTFIKATREAFVSSLTNSGIDNDRTYGLEQKTTTAAFAWALIVESVLLNEQLVHDIQETAAAKGMPAPPSEGIPFYLPSPPEEARGAFNDYVRIRFPIHVFALDPVNQEQNLADQLARSRETQLALSLAFVTGNISAGNMTRFARRMELDAETIALNRTQVAFSHGEDVFGWRFQPRFQTPPTQNNLAAFAQTIIGGPTRDGDRRQLEIEPGMRECVALVIMPSFVPYVSFETRANWFRLNRPKHSEINPLKFLELSKSVQRARSMYQSICDAGLYRDGDVARLLSRVNQLAAALPMQTMIAQVPYENTHGGFELFNYGVTDLGPELRSWYGAPGVSLNNGTSLYLVGDSFSVNQTSVVVGNKMVSPTLLSRQVIRVDVPPGTQTVTRGGHAYVEASIATPYGVSQPLYIPAVDAAAPSKPSTPAAAAKPSAFSIDPKTQTLQISYTLKDAIGKSGVGNGTLSPNDQKLNILWTSPTGLAPKEIQLQFSFTYNKKPPIKIPTVAIKGAGSGGSYTIDATALASLAKEYVDQLNGLDLFTKDNPLPKLTTDAIQVTPIADDKVSDKQPVETSNSLTIEPSLVGQ